MASKHYHIKFNFDHDKEIIDRIESKENKNDYIRGLVLSDIAADILRSSIKLEDLKESFDSGNTHAVHEPVTSDVESFDQDPDELQHQARIDFYHDNCPAISNLDSIKNPCDGCKFDVHYTDVDGKAKTACSLEDEWDQYWARKCKTKLSSLYGKMIRDPFKDDVIEKMMEEKTDG